MAELNELDALAAQAGAVDSQAAAQAPEAMAQAQQEAEVMTLADSNGRTITGVLEMAAPMISPLFPSVAAVYTPDVCASVGGALGPLLAKYGINLGEWAGAHKEELTALFVCAPVAMATYKALKVDVEARAKPEPQKLASGDAGPPKPAGALKPGDYGYVEPGA